MVGVVKAPPKESGSKRQRNVKWVREEETAGLLAVCHATKNVHLATHDDREALAQEHYGAKLDMMVRHLDMMVQHLGWRGKTTGQENKIRGSTRSMNPRRPVSMVGT